MGNETQRNGRPTKTGRERETKGSNITDPEEGRNLPLSDGGCKSKVPKTSKILTESF